MTCSKKDSSWKQRNMCDRSHWRVIEEEKALVCNILNILRDRQDPGRDGVYSLISIVRQLHFLWSFLEQFVHLNHGYLTTNVYWRRVTITLPHSTIFHHIHPSSILSPNVDRYTRFILYLVFQAGVSIINCFLLLSLSCHSCLKMLCQDLICRSFSWWGFWAV